MTAAPSSKCRHDVISATIATDNTSKIPQIFGGGQQFTLVTMEEGLAGEKETTGKVATNRRFRKINVNDGSAKASLFLLARRQQLSLTSGGGREVRFTTWWGRTFARFELAK